eukprot:11531707-Karenia_brevis.AAC.1
MSTLILLECARREEHILANPDAVIGLCKRKREHHVLQNRVAIQNRDMLDRIRGAKSFVDSMYMHTCVIIDACILA